MLQVRPAQQPALQQHQEVSLCGDPQYQYSYLHTGSNRSLTNPDFLKGCINLNHLNLSGTGVRKFDKAFLKLAELRHLELKDMRDLEIANFDFLRDSP
jgi:hypothetical protein